MIILHLTKHLFNLNFGTLENLNPSKKSTPKASFWGYNLIYGLSSANFAYFFVVVVSPPANPHTFPRF